MEKNQEIKTLTVIEHILKRPATYIGAMSPNDIDDWIFDDDGRLVFKRITFAEGLKKIINEALDNSIDEAIKTDFRKSNRISIRITDNEFSIEDNGRGIPTDMKNMKPQAVTAMTVPMSGSNYEDDESRQTIGVNGLGIKAANIFSKEFVCVTCDGKRKIRIVCEDNLRKSRYEFLETSKSTGTSVSFKPDFARFQCDRFDPIYGKMMETRLAFLSWAFPKIQFKLNGIPFKSRSKDVGSMFSGNCVSIEGDNYYIGLYPTDEHAFLTYVNGISLRRGGSHLNYVISGICDSMRTKLSRKYPAIKPADVKARLGVVILFKNFSDCQFDSQTKETLTNVERDTGKYLKDNGADLEELVRKAISDKEIVSNITEMFRLKEELARKKELDKLVSEKKPKEFSSDKFYPEMSRSGKDMLFICEGQSAYGGLAPILGRQGKAYYCLKGKLKNVASLSLNEILKNEECKELIAILNIDKRNGQATNLAYRKVVIAADADLDGIHICALVLAFFNRLCPGRIRQVCRLKTPIAVSYDDRKNVTGMAFKYKEVSKLPKRGNLLYFKGLGTWDKSLLQQVIRLSGGLDRLLEPFEPDDMGNESLMNWLGNDSEFRKDRLRGRPCDITKA